MRNFLKCFSLFFSKFGDSTDLYFSYLTLCYFVAFFRIDYVNVQRFH